MNTQNKPCTLVNCSFVVRDAGSIRGTYLTQDGPRARHNVWDPEAVSDLDQLATRNDHLIASGKLMQYEKDGRRIVIDRYGRFSQHALQQCGDMLVSSAAFTCL